MDFSLYRACLQSPAALGCINALLPLSRPIALGSCESCVPTWSGSYRLGLDSAIRCCQWWKPKPGTQGKGKAILKALEMARHALAQGVTLLWELRAQAATQHPLVYGNAGSVIKP